VTEKFVIGDGLFSHWQVWLAIGIVLQALSANLDRYGKRHLLSAVMAEPGNPR
jgi:hypothetical protein